MANEVGVFYRVFWANGSSSDFAPVQGAAILEAHAAYHDDDWHPGVMTLPDVNGVLIQFHPCTVASIHESTPVNRAAWYTRNALFDAEERANDNSLPWLTD